MSRVARASVGRLVAVAALSGLPAVPAAAAGVGPYTAFWALGDSLSDDGNLFDLLTDLSLPVPNPSPPYFQGRFSNGPVWAELVADAFRAEGLPTGNSAFGGAKAVPEALPLPPGLPQQVLIFDAERPDLGARPLVSVWFGSNDLFDVANQGVEAAEALGALAAEKVGEAALDLQALGVDDLLLPNLPDLGDTPRFSLINPAPGPAASAGVAAFNAQLALEADALRGAGLGVIELDVAGLFDALIDDPAAFGLADATLPCLFPDAAAAASFGQPLLCDDPSERAFFDAIHPNAVVHQRLADVALGELMGATVIPLPPAGALLLAGLGLLGLSRARGSAAGQRWQRAQ